ncbi:MAG: FAD-dependent oxidoreductase [Acidobacteria bacterium]|nr:FAD-dependent oxidoreductase [Acidobacteriota bacterium]
MRKKMSSSSNAVVTRRHFLEQLGLVGGTSLVMTAMNSWDLMAGGAQERPHLTGKPTKNKVIVLGAGVSGLVTAYELGKLGYDVRVIEARDRVGGLNWTVRKGTEHQEIGATEKQVCAFDEGLYVNVGPWRIPYTHTGVLGYCREVGVPVEIFINEAENSYFYYEGEQFGSLAGKRLRLREVKADMLGHVNELLVKAIDQNKLDMPMTAEDKDRFVKFLVSEGYLDPTTKTYKAIGDSGRQPYDTNALLKANIGTRFRSVPLTDGTQAAPIFQPIGGMDQFPKGLARAIGAQKISMNTEVISVRQDESGVKVAVLDTKTGKKSELTADFCAVCLPMPIIAKMDIAFSPEMLNAAKAVATSNSAKMGLQMKRRWWEEDDQIFGGHLYSNLPLGEFSYPSTGYFSKKGIILGMYANGPVGNLLDATPAQRVEHVVSNSSKVHPQMRTEFENAFGVWWKKVKYSEGGYATGSASARREQLSKMENRLVIGSAAVCPYSEPDWQEGAVSAGWQTVKTIHERAMKA